VVERVVRLNPEEEWRHPLFHVKARRDALLASSDVSELLDDVIDTLLFEDFSHEDMESAIKLALASNKKLFTKERTDTRNLIKEYVLTVLIRKNARREQLQSVLALPPEVMGPAWDKMDTYGQEFGDILQSFLGPNPTRGLEEYERDVRLLAIRSKLLPTQFEFTAWYVCLTTSLTEQKRVIAYALTPFNRGVNDRPVTQSDINIFLADWRSEGLPDWSEDELESGLDTKKYPTDVTQEISDFERLEALFDEQDRHLSLMRKTIEEEDREEKSKAN